MKSSCLTPLGNLVSIVMGQAPPGSSSNFGGRGTPFVKAGEFGESRPIIREWTTQPLKFAKSGDVLLCVVGATCGKINLGVDCAIGRSVAAIRPDPERLDQFYLHYFLMTLVESLRAGSTGAAQTVISKEMIQALQLPWQPLPDQRRIVAILDEAFAAIATAKANTEKNLQNAREVFEGYLESVLAQGGAGWVEAPIVECFKVRSGDFLPAKAMASDGAIPVYGGNGVAGSHNQSNLSGEQIIIGRVGAKCGNVRHVSGDIWLTDNAFHISHYLRPFEPAFLARLLNLKNLRQTANQAAQPVISYTTIKGVLLSFPVEIRDQQRLAAQLDDLEEHVANAEATYNRKLTALEELKKSLLYQTFTGALTAKSTDKPLEAVA